MFQVFSSRRNSDSDKKSSGPGYLRRQLHGYRTNADVETGKRFEQQMLALPAYIVCLLLHLPTCLPALLPPKNLQTRSRRPQPTQIVPHVLTAPPQTHITSVPGSAAKLPRANVNQHPNVSAANTKNQLRLSCIPTKFNTLLGNTALALKTSAKKKKPC